MCLVFISEDESWFLYDLGHSVAVSALRFVPAITEANNSKHKSMTILQQPVFRLIWLSNVSKMLILCNLIQKTLILQYIWFDFHQHVPMHKVCKNSTVISNLLIVLVL